MRLFLLSLIWIILLTFSSSANDAEAQIVSLLVDSGQQEDSSIMDHEMKKHLHAEGYEVNGMTPGEGFFLYVQFMPIKTVREQRQLRGYAGSLFVGSQAWTRVVDSFMPDGCNITTYQKMKNNIGMEMVLLDSQIFTDSSIHALAELMSARASRIIRGKSEEMTALMMEFAEK